jgi:hypothetical protein
MSEGFLSANALNLPWVAGFLYKLLFSYSFSRQDELQALGPSSIYLLPFKIIFWIFYGLVVILAICKDKSFQCCLLFSIVGCVTYVIWNAGVHENHMFVAVILAYMLMLHKYTPEHWAITIILAAMLNINMFVFYGVTGTELQSRVVGIDLSVTLAMLYVIAWLFLVVHALTAAQPRKEERASVT